MSFFRNLTFEERLANAVESCLRYLGKFVWPTKLAIVYPHPAHGYALNEAWPLWQIVAGAAVLLLLFVWCLTRLRRQPYLAVGWFWFLGTLVPVIGLVQVGEQSMANRYTYIPLIGPAIALVWGIWDAAAALSFSGKQAIAAKTNPPPGRGPRSALILPWALCSLLLAGLVWGTHRQILHWRDTLSLFSYAIAVTPDNPSAHFALGVALEKAGQISQAMVQYRVALAIDPSYAKADYNLGQLFSKAGDLPSAVAHFRAAVRSNPNDLASRLNLANSLQRLGRTKDAVPVYEECIRRDPDSIEALNNLAWILATDPDPQFRNGARAVQLAERAVELSHSTLPVMIGTLAAAYAEAGRFGDAVAAAEKAVAAAAEQAQPEVVQRNRELIELYRAGKPYHEPRR
jgi:tetratricopeptide (TPR) repeat protein